jgi:DNA repair exonuclease SbcCD ATPase subunit
MPESAPPRKPRSILSAVLATLLSISADPRLAAAVLSPFEDEGGGSGSQDAYVLAQGKSWMSTNTTLEDIIVIRRKLSGDFLWFRRGGKANLVQDPETLEEAYALFKPLRALDPERQALERRNRALEKKREPLEREQEKLDRLSDRLDDHEEQGRSVEAARRDLEGRLRDLETRLRALEGEEREIEALESSLELKEEALEKKAEGHLWRLIDRTVRRGAALPTSVH